LALSRLHFLNTINQIDHFETTNPHSFKVTTPNCNLFVKLTSINSQLKCTGSLHGNLRLILDTPISSTLKIHSLFIQSPKKAFEENLKSPFDSQQDPTII